MDFGNILKKSWDALWKLKFLWVFGFLLAMTTTISAAGWLWSAYDRDINGGITFEFDDQSYKIIGEGVIIDFTGPGAPEIRLTDVNLRELEQLRTGFEEFGLFDLWIVPAFAGIELLILLLIRALLRYSSESAVIHSVDAYDKADRRVGFGRAFRYGWSRTAVRLFGIDVLIFLGVALFVGTAFLIALVPVLLAIASGSEATIILAAGLTFMLLVGWSMILGVAVLASSLIRQVSWRACGVENLGVVASIRKGLAHLENDFAHLFLAWITWLAIGFGWILAIIPIAIILFPVLLLSILAGVVVGMVPGFITWAVANLFVSGITAIILGVLVGLPVFALVTVAPILFVAGFVHIYQSNIWTLVYRQLPAPSQLVASPAPDPVEPELEALPVG